MSGPIRKAGEGARARGGGALVVFAATTLAVASMSWSEVPGRSGLIPLAWGLAAWLPMAGDERWKTRLGLAGSDVAAGLKAFAVSTVVLLPLGVAGLELYLRTGLPVPASEPLAGVTPGEWSVYQLGFVAPFEELFFRGFLQHRFDRACRSAGMRATWTFWLPIVGSALLFGLAHVVVTRSLAGAAVAIPGLLFGWLRAKSGSLVAPVLAHGTANVVTRLLLLRAAGA